MATNGKIKKPMTMKEDDGVDIMGKALDALGAVYICEIYIRVAKVGHRLWAIERRSRRGLTSRGYRRIDKEKESQRRSCISYTYIEQNLATKHATISTTPLEGDVYVLDQKKSSFISQLGTVVERILRAPEGPAKKIYRFSSSLELRSHLITSSHVTVRHFIGLK